MIKVCANYNNSSGFKPYVVRNKPKPWNHCNLLLSL